MYEGVYNTDRLPYGNIETVVDWHVKVCHWVAQVAPFSALPHTSQDCEHSCRRIWMRGVPWRRIFEATDEYGFRCKALLGIFTYARGQEHILIDEVRFQNWASLPPWEVGAIPLIKERFAIRCESVKRVDLVIRDPAHFDPCFIFISLDISEFFLVGPSFVSLEIISERF